MFQVKTDLKCIFSGDPFFSGLRLDASVVFDQCNSKFRVYTEDAQIRILYSTRNPHFSRIQKVEKIQLRICKFLAKTFSISSYKIFYSWRRVSTKVMFKTLGDLCLSCDLEWQRQHQ